MHLIVYTSRYAGIEQNVDQALTNICQSSKRNNPAKDITGLLFYHNNRFLQILEGEKEQLENLLDVLEHDERHSEVERLVDSPITTRDFKQWNMDTFNLSADETIDAKELSNIAKAYQNMVIPEAKVLSDFYRQIIESRKLS